MIRFEHPSLGEYRARTAEPGRLEGGRRVTEGARRTGTPERPLVTIVTAVRNSDRFLAEAIDSVIEQSYPNVEYVVADGGSTDGTLDILRSYGDRIDYWISERDRSMFDGMNRAVALASGELVKIHGADDVVPRDSAALAVEAWTAKGRSASCVIRSDMDIIDEDGRVIERAGLAQAQRFMPPVLHPTWWVPLALYERIGLYDPNAVVSSDNEMYFHLLEQGVEFVHLETPLAAFRSGGTSSTFAGLRDTFAINHRYLGLNAATYVAAVHTLRRSARFAVEQTLGGRRSTALRRAIKNLWR